jgi:hypothetical protein
VTARLSAPLVLAVCLLARGALAQPEPEVPADPAMDPTPPPALPAIDPRKEGAEQHRLRAIRFYDARNFSAAREEFLVAYELVPSHRLLYNLAVVSMALGDSANAYDYFERCLRDGGDAVPAARRAEIEAQLRDLASHVAVLNVRVDVHGAEVSVDGRPIGVAPLSGPIHLNAGTHEVIARSLGRWSRRRIVVSGGEGTVVDFDLSPPKKPRPPAEDGGRTRWLWVGWTTTGVLTAGAVFSGFKALDAQSDYEAEFGRLDADRGELDRLDSRAGKWALATDILGGAALVSGAVSLYFTLNPAGSHQKAGREGDTRSRRYDIVITARSARATLHF